jgi:hypothetical protein
MVHASALSYLTPREIEGMSASFGPTAKVTPVPIGEYQAVVITNDYVSIVAFRVVGVNVPIALPWAQLAHVGELRYFDTAGKLHSGSPPFLQALRDSACAPGFEAGAEFAAHRVRRYLGVALQGVE